MRCWNCDNRYTAMSEWERERELCGPCLDAFADEFFEKMPDLERTIRLQGPFSTQIRAVVNAIRRDLARREEQADGEETE